MTTAHLPEYKPGHFGLLWEANSQLALIQLVTELCMPCMHSSKYMHESLYYYLVSQDGVGAGDEDAVWRLIRGCLFIFDDLVRVIAQQVITHQLLAQLWYPPAWHQTGIVNKCCYDT